MTKFSGFSKEMPGFLHDLKANNEKVWFEANRNRFEKVCVEPCMAFIESVSDWTAGAKPQHKAEAKTNGSFRRIFRDTRFSKDKTPYHTYLHLIFWAGSHPTRSPGLHLVFSPGGFGIGAGQWQFSPEELKAYRQAVLDQEKCAALNEAVALAKKAECHLEAPVLKMVPKGFAANDGNEIFLRQKGIVVRNRNEDYPDGFFDQRCREMLLARLEKLLPLQKWLMENVAAE